MDSYKLNALKQNLQDYAEHHLPKSKNNMFC